MGLCTWWRDGLFSRYVLAWELSTTLETGFCVTALQHALMSSKPEIFNTDQGVQFISAEFLDPLTQGNPDQYGWTRPGLR